MQIDERDITPILNNLYREAIDRRVRQIIKHNLNPFGTTPEQYAEIQLNELTNTEFFEEIFI